MPLNLDPNTSSDERLSRYESFLENFDLGPWDSSRELGSQMVFLGFMRVPGIPSGASGIYESPIPANGIYARPELKL